MTAASATGDDPARFGVFVSHITEEAHVARAMKEHIQRAIPGASVFASTEDIQLGQDWRATLRRALDQTIVLIVLCSARSIVRPWINFEAGSGWLREILIIPVCHSGLRKAALPDPLRTFQVLELVDHRDCRRLVDTVAARLTLTSAPDYRYDEMMLSLFRLPSRGHSIGVLHTHRQNEWENNTATLFDVATQLPPGMSGQWSFDPISKVDDLLSVDLHAYAGLIVGSPWRSRMTPEVIAALVDFVMQGGRILLLGFELGDRHHDGNLNDLAARFGVYLEADIVGPQGQGRSKKVSYDTPLDFTPTTADSHELTRGLQAIKLANVQTIRVLPLGREWLRVGANVASRPSPATTVYRDGKFSTPEGGDEVDPNPMSGWLAVAVEAPAGLCGRGAVQAVGTWDVLGRKRPFDHRDNLVLLGRLFEWLSGRPVSDSFTICDNPRRVEADL